MKKIFFIICFIAIFAMTTFGQIIVSNETKVFVYENDVNNYIDWNNRTYVISETGKYLNEYTEDYLLNKVTDKISDFIKQTSINSKKIILNENESDEYFKKINQYLDSSTYYSLKDDAKGTLTITYKMSMDKVIGQIIANDTSIENRTKVDIDKKQIEKNKKNIYIKPHLLYEDMAWDGKIVYDARKYENIKFCMCPVIADEEGNILFDSKDIYNVFKPNKDMKNIQVSNEKDKEVKGFKYVTFKNKDDKGYKNINKTEYKENPLIVTPVYISNDYDICLADEDIKFLINFGKDNSYLFAGVWSKKQIKAFINSIRRKQKTSDFDLESGEIWASIH